MKKSHYKLAGLVLICLCGSVAGQRQLGNDEILEIIRNLTDQARDTWIQNGVIHARHLEYRATTELVIESNVTVKYDGSRFFWEINIDSCSTEDAIMSNTPHDEIDMNWNARRAFVWDGQKYTMYFRPGNHAIVTEDTSDIPVSVNGPLTAGLVPWGYGIFTYEKLSVAQSSAVEVEKDSRKEIHLAINMTGKPKMTFVLDPAKAYAVLTGTATDAGRSIIVKTCSDYIRVVDRWVPEKIEIEKYDASKPTPELLSYDNWNITSINTSISGPIPFSVDYESDALVEHYAAVSKKPLSYYYSDEVDTDSLRQERLTIAATQNTATQNCATVALKYAMSRLAKQVTQQQLAGLVSETDKTTTLYAMKQFVSGVGLHCLAVKTNIQTLKNLTNCYAILHLPGENHFVVLDHIDEQRVWLIDLDRDKFYFPTRTDMFKLDWTAGTALLVAKETINLPSGVKEIRDQDLKRIVGADGFGAYSCTHLLQDGKVVFCPDVVSGFCQGRYRMYYERFGCELASQGGSCDGTGMIGSIWCSCVEDVAYPGECISDGQWYSQYIRACK